MKNIAKEDLRALCAEFGYDFSDDGGAIALYFPCGEGRVVVVYLTAQESLGTLRALGVASGLALSRESLLDAYEFANAWNANRTFPRAVVGGVEGDGPLSFGVDMSIYTNEEVSKEYLKTNFFELFFSAAQDFFQAAYATFTQSQAQ